MGNMAYNMSLLLPCRFLCLLDARDWVPFALEYCTLEHRSHKRAEFLLSLEALQVRSSIDLLFWLL